MGPRLRGDDGCVVVTGLTAIWRRAIEKAAMPVRLDTSSADFTGRFNAFLAMKREVAADIEAATRAIVDDVAARGDAALLEATRKFDRLELAATGFCPLSSE